MAKYSTGGGGGSAGGSCELCGAEDVDLSAANVAGATLQVCDTCASHGDQTAGSGEETRTDVESEQDRRKRAAQNTAKVHDAQKGDSSHWEDGASYDDDQLPYLVADYGEVVTDARQDAGLQTAELAEELNVDETDILAIEQGRATKAGVGGSLIGALEQRLDIELAE
jgi:ribosome-binding protein aMBF1 (putative translation factor)